MQRLLLLGLNHTTAPLAVRERLAFNAAQRKAAVADLRAAFPDCEVVLVSTCNRVELYLCRPIHARPKVDDVVEFLAKFHSIPSDSFRPHLYEKTNREVVDHLFSVAASLDSMVLGETQIIGQVREAYDASRALNAAGAMLHPLFQRAIAVGKQVMSQTALSEGRLSVASVAVDYARQIFDRFTDKVILSIGAGKMANLMLQNLAALSPRRLMICNRDPAKAALLAEKYKGEAVPFESLNEHLVAADIVATSTGSQHPIITTRSFEQLIRQRRYRSIFLIDIALPRDVEAGVGEIDNVYLYNLDDLQQVVSQTQALRKDAIAAARKIVADQVEEFTLWHRTREMGPIIDQLYKRYHALAQEELVRTFGKLSDLSPDEKAHLEDLARRLVNKFLHDPVTTLRNCDPLHGPAVQYLSALQKLFQLNDQETPDE